MLRHTLITLTAAFLVAQTPAPEIAKPATPKVEAPVREDKVMARVGNRTFRESDFELFLSMALNPQQRMQMEMVQGAKETYRKQFLDFKVMEIKARKDGMDTGPEYLKKRELMEAQILIQDLMKRDAPALQKKVVVTDADVKAYFEKHTDQFKSPESFNSRHLLISVKGGPNASPTALSDEDAKAKAILAAKALAEGKTWDVVAKEFSDDPGSKEKGGLYENITFGSFAPEYEAAVRKQEIGKVGEPIKTAFGYHVIQVEKINSVFETVKDQVRQKVQTGKQEEVFQGFIDGLKKELGFTEAGAIVIAEKEAKKLDEPKAKASKKSGIKK